MVSKNNLKTHFFAWAVQVLDVFSLYSSTDNDIYLIETLKSVPGAVPINNNDIINDDGDQDVQQD